MRILHVSFSDQNGGAARAAYRIHRSLVDYGIDSEMLVLDKRGDDPSVKLVSPSVSGRIERLLQRRWLARRMRGWQTDNPVLHSFGTIGAGLVHELNACDADILHLHWIIGMLAIGDIGRLRKPIIWTLHDMWAFCGGEHYVPDNNEARFRVGYKRGNRPAGEFGPDLDRIAWQAKRRAWAKQRFTIVCPSQWLAGCAKESVLFTNMPMHVIPNPIEANFPWRPIPRDAARGALSLPEKSKLILTGAVGGLSDSRKGGNLLHGAIERIVGTGSGTIELMIFGQRAPPGPNAWPCKVHWLGAVRDDRVLALAYSAADVMVVPSRQEAFGQTASEALACGTPVVAFNCTGLSDVVSHKESGYLAEPYSIEDLAEGIQWVLSDKNRHQKLSYQARRMTVERFAYSEVAQQYIMQYNSIMAPGKIR